PSFYEGQGLPPLEAQAAAVPDAASSAASLPEVLGEEAIYFDPENPDDIARAILLGRKDEKISSRLKAEGPKQAARFTWSRTAEDTLRVYRQACGVE
ncbi:MAG: glycosyltransferase, partial [Candidatus Aureabacteria bacterium]|nr:glycosyltransferase [Candidatus Auribacterota bacterium]